MRFGCWLSVQRPRRKQKHTLDRVGTQPSISISTYLQHITLTSAGRRKGEKQSDKRQHRRLSGERVRKWPWSLVHRAVSLSLACLLCSSPLLPVLFWSDKPCTDWGATREKKKRSKSKSRVSLLNDHLGDVRRIHGLVRCCSPESVLDVFLWMEFMHLITISL